MAQKTIKDYFPSRKIQDKGKGATTKRLLESSTVPRSKRRRVTKVLTGKPEEKLRSSDKTQDSKCNITTNLRSGLSSTLTTSFCERAPDPRGEETPVNSSIVLNCFETLPSTLSPLRRGAECVRLALEKKTSSPVTLGRDEEVKAPRLNDTCRKLFSSEVSNSAGVTAKHHDDDEAPLPPVKKPESKAGGSISSTPVKQSINGITPLKNDKTSTRSKQVPKLKPFTSLQYDSPTKNK